MIKRTIAHREELSVPVNLVKSDWTSKIITEDDGIQRVKAGTLISLKTSSEDIRIDVTDDDKFKLMRGEKVAQNLSEGEKTAISFAYFLNFQHQHIQ